MQEAVSGKWRDGGGSADFRARGQGQGSRAGAKGRVGGLGADAKTAVTRGADDGGVGFRPRPGRGYLASLQQSLPQTLPWSLQHSTQDLPLSAQHFLQASPAKALVLRAVRARRERSVFMGIQRWIWVSRHEVPTRGRRGKRGCRGTWVPCPMGGGQGRSFAPVPEPVISDRAGRLRSTGHSAAGRAGRVRFVAAPAGRRPVPVRRWSARSKTRSAAAPTPGEQPEPGGVRQRFPEKADG